MRSPGIRFIVLFALFISCFAASFAAAQTPYFQNKTIKIVRGGEPGGTGDLQARALKDPEFTKEFKKLMATDASPLTGEEVEVAIRELPCDPEIVSLYKKMAEHGPLPAR